MSIRFNHTIVRSRDKAESATFLTDILGLPSPTSFGPFLVVELENGASLDFVSADDAEVVPQHYAFLIDEVDFDPILGRIRARGLDYWADPLKTRLGEINHNDGGRAESAHFLSRRVPSRTVVGACGTSRAARVIPGPEVA